MARDLSKFPVGSKVSLTSDPNDTAEVIEWDEEQGFLLLMFQPGSINGWHGSGKSPKGKSLLNDRTYYWMYPQDLILRQSAILKKAAPSGYWCIECNNRNEYAEANLTGDRHICFSCRASYLWKYTDQLM